MVMIIQSPPWSHILCEKGDALSNLIITSNDDDLVYVIGFLGATNLVIKLIITMLVLICVMTMIIIVAIMLILMIIINHVIKAVPCALMIDIAVSVGKLTRYLFKKTCLCHYYVHIIVFCLLDHKPPTLGKCNKRPFLASNMPSLMSIPSPSSLSSTSSQLK